MSFSDKGIKKKQARSIIICITTELSPTNSTNPTSSFFNLQFLT